VFQPLEWPLISDNLRLAPENPYPAAVHDSWEALTYMLTTGINEFNLNPTLIAVGGSSAGANLAAVMTHKLLTHNFNHPKDPLPFFKAQLLIVPVTDNTASIWNNDSWRENEFSPALPAAKMLWYRNHYLPDERMRGEPEASPLLYSDDASGVKERWRRLPRALVVVGELDVLREEGVAYAQRLLKNGVGVQLKVMKGMPHPFLAMNGALQQGQDTISYMVQILSGVLRKQESEG
jgi:acetyl esterase/lipase